MVVYDPIGHSLLLVYIIQLQRRVANKEDLIDS